MTADAEGNDLEKVFIPVTGFLAVQLTGEPTWVDPTEGSATPLVLPEGYVKVGLFKQDGGPQDGSDKEEDKAKYDALTEEEKAMLADVTSTATMSLNDSHGDILAAIRDSLNNQVAIELTVE